MDLDPGEVLFAVLAGEVQRERAKRTGLWADGPRRNPGLNPGAPEQPSTSKNEDGVPSAVPATVNPSGVRPGALHGVKSVVVTAGPHAAGLSNDALGPPLRLIFSSLNGNCGLPRNFVVSCPVAGFASTNPCALILIPVFASAPVPPSSR